MTVTFLDAIIANGESSNVSHFQFFLYWKWHSIYDFRFDLDSLIGHLSTWDLYPDTDAVRLYDPRPEEWQVIATGNAIESLLHWSQ